MAKNVIVDAGFLIALLGGRDLNHAWAVAQAPRYAPPWKTCEAVVSEAFHLLGVGGLPALSELLLRRRLLVEFDLGNNLGAVLALMKKYTSVPMSLADACLVRMTETYADCLVLTTDTDFHIYRRHSRQVVPCVLP